MGDELVIQIQLRDTQSKCKKKRKRVYSKQTKKSVKWQDFDHENLISLGKRVAQNKSGYEFGVQYDFREFFFQQEWNNILKRGLAMEDRKDLVPLNIIENISGNKKEDDKQEN